MLTKIELSEIKTNHYYSEKSDKVFLDLCNSIKKVGLINPLLLDEKHNLIDGRARYEACKQLDIKQVPVRITKESGLCKAAYRVEIDPVEYKKNLVRLIKQYPEMSINEFATKLGVTQEKLLKKLLQLDDKTAQSVIEDKITLLQSIQ